MHEKEGKKSEREKEERKNRKKIASYSSSSVGWFRAAACCPCRSRVFQEMEKKLIVSATFYKIL